MNWTAAAFGGLELGCVFLAGGCFHAGDYIAFSLLAFLGFMFGLAESLSQ